MMCELFDGYIKQSYLFSINMIYHIIVPERWELKINFPKSKFNISVLYNFINPGTHVEYVATHNPA